MSLRGRLLASVATAALVVVAITCGLTYLALRGSLYQRLGQSLRADTAALQTSLAAGTALSSATVSAEAPGAFVELRRPDGQVLASVSAVDAGGQHLICDVPAQVSAGRGGPSAASYFDAPGQTPGSAGFRGLSTTLTDGNELLVALPTSGIDGTLRRLLVTDLGIGIAALATALLLGWWLVRTSLRPLRGIERTASLIATGDLQQRVAPTDPGTEVGQVGRAINVMLDRIQLGFAERAAVEADLRASEARLRRFVADASHELRTPLTAVSAYAQMLQGGARTDPGAHQRAIAGITAETGRMGVLVDDLLLLARLDQGRPLERQPVEVVDLVATAVSAAVAVDPDHPVSLQTSAPVEMVGDPGRLRQVLDNLLGNVRAHTAPGVRTDVRVAQRDGWAFIEVADDGPGFAAPDLPHVMERFYRGDAARVHRPGSGSGLGLAIAQAVITAHGGYLTADNGRSGGAVLTVILPLRPPD